jgi:hypothetical protein
MYIFNRSTTLNRHRLMEATGAAVEVAGMVSEITGMAVSVFASRFGQPLNTIGWSTRLESQAELQAATDKLIANEDYLGWISSHTELFEAAPSDQLSTVVSSTLAAEPKRFYTLLTAAAANGRLADAVAFGVRAQQFVADTTGMATAFMSGVYGAFGTVAWLTGADSMGELDDLVAMQMTNADYHALVAEAGPLFLPGSGTTGLIEKIN